MRAINRTPFRFAPHVGRLGFPSHSLTLIVKGTFDLSNGSEATPAEEQLHPTGDGFFPDDLNMQGSCRYESDFAHFKPRADLLLAGTCHPAEGRPVRACPVTFQVGARARTLRVSGDRHWQGPPGLRRISEPLPFTQMKLSFENSFGGRGFKPNPAGKGYRSEETESGQKTWPLPNIEDPDDLVSSTRSRPRPAGFGPLGRMWQQRAARLGTYKDRWVKERWPWFAEDFDYAHFNAAPRQMQVEGYLRGDESLLFENLHPEHSRYEARLPGIRVRCFLHEQIPQQDESAGFREVPMKLDTLWADMDAEKLVLVWRGWTAVQSEEFEEMQHVFIMPESVQEATAALEQCHELFLASLAQAEKQPEAAPEEPEDEPSPESSADQAEPGGIDADPTAAREELRGQADAQLNSLLAKAGIDADGLPPQAREKAQRERDRLLDTLTETDPARAQARDREAMQAQMSEALSGVGIDMKNLPPVSKAAAQEQVRLLRELGVEDVEAVFANPDMAGFFAIMAAVLPKAGIDPEDLTPLIDEAKKHKAKMGLAAGTQDDQEEAPESEGRRRPLTREIVAEEADRGEPFAEEDLSGLDLSGLDLKEIDFSGANLSEALLNGSNLSGAILTGADFGNANLSEADLSGASLAGADLTSARLEKACLENADLTGAKLAGAVLTEATLTDAVFLEAEMSGAALERVEAAGARFIGADLTGARLLSADLRGADFSRGNLNGADLGASNLSNASIEGAACVEAKFDEADLTKLRASEGTDFSRCSFVKAQGPESIWGDANLTEADFSFAQMQRASFMGATLQGANLYAADMKHARFIKADLQRARLVQMNLFEGSLEKAVLSEADLSGSNMYAVEFLDAVLTGTRLTGTNLRMTKLQKS